MEHEASQQEVKFKKMAPWTRTIKLKICESQVSYPLLQPENDKEIRNKARKTTVNDNVTVTFVYFGDWEKLMNIITLQVRRNWTKDNQNLKVGGVVFLKDYAQAYFMWPT